MQNPTLGPIFFGTLPALAGGGQVVVNEAKEKGWMKGNIKEILTSPPRSRVNR